MTYSYLHGPLVVVPRDDSLWDRLHDHLCMSDPTGNRLNACGLPKGHPGDHVPIKPYDILIAAAILRKQGRL